MTGAFVKSCQESSTSRHGERFVWKVLSSVGLHHLYDTDPASTCHRFAALLTVVAYRIHCVLPSLKKTSGHKLRIESNRLRSEEDTLTRTLIVTQVMTLSWSARIPSQHQFVRDIVCYLMQYCQFQVPLQATLTWTITSTDSDLWTLNPASFELWTLTTELPKQLVINSLMVSLSYCIVMWIEFCPVLILCVLRQLGTSSLNQLIASSIRTVQGHRYPVYVPVRHIWRWRYLIDISETGSSHVTFPDSPTLGQTRCELSVTVLKT